MPEQKSSKYCGKQDMLSSKIKQNLVSDDGERIWAHKVVLSSASPIFRDILQYNKDNREDKFIHMKIKSRSMSAMVDIV